MAEIRLRVFNKAGSDYILFAWEYDGTKTVLDVINESDVQSAWVKALATSQWWTMVGYNTVLETLIYWSNYVDLYDVTPIPPVDITHFFRNWIKYQFEWNNELPSWWTSWQALTKITGWYAWQDLPASWITNDTTSTTYTIEDERVWTGTEFWNLNSFWNTIYIINE